MGIFSLFGKKNGQQVKSAGKSSSRTTRTISSSRTDSGKTNTRSQTSKRDAQAALATALKIDAIESEMSSEFVNATTTLTGNTKTALDTTASTVKPVKSTVAPKSKPAPVLELSPSSKPPVPKTEAKTSSVVALDMGTTTGFLLNGQTAVADIATPSSEAAAVIEEAAIMYANGQTDVVEQMLRMAIAEDRLGNTTLKAWLMLFDLYQVMGKQSAFDHLSIDYANKFETSPPAWVHTQRAQNTPAAGTTPMVPFSGKLDDTSVKQIERIQRLAENYHALRLEFVRVTEVTPAGCRLLLQALNKLHKSGHALILVGAPELADKIRKILEVGRRDDTEDAWLLLLEILRLLNREKEFEETSIDFCVTFEVSPPAFVPPQNKVTTATEEAPAAGVRKDAFKMPALVEGRIDNLIVSLASYSDEHNPAIIDCSQLLRVDFSAAGRLLTGLAPFCGVGKSIEFHDVNHLIVELFNVIGLKDIVRIVPRKS